MDADSNDLFATEEAVELYDTRAQEPELFIQERKAIERYFRSDGGRVLDVGCGVGRVSHLLHERGYEITGIDISEPLVAKARSLFPDIDFRVEDVRDTPFDSVSFEYAIFSYFGIDYVLPKAERIRALREIHRLLKPGGILVLSSHNSWHPFVPLSVRDLGMALKDVYDLYLRRKNRERIGSPYKIESVPLGEIEIYLTNPISQWIQLCECGYTPLDVLGTHDGFLRFVDRNPHYVARK